MDLLIGQCEWFSGGEHDGRIEAEAPSLAPGRGLLDGPFNAAQDQLACRTTLPCGSFVQAAVQIARQIDTGADRIGLHRVRIDQRLK